MALPKVTERNIKMFHAYLAGESYTHIAMRHGISRQRVVEVCKGVIKDIAKGSPYTAERMQASRDPIRQEIVSKTPAKIIRAF